MMVKITTLLTVLLVVFSINTSKSAFCNELVTIGGNAQANCIVNDGICDVVISTGGPHSDPTNKGGTYSACTISSFDYYCNSNPSQSSYGGYSYFYITHTQLCVIPPGYMHFTDQFYVFYSYECYQTPDEQE